MRESRGGGGVRRAGGGRGGGGIEVFNLPKPQTCKNPQGFGSIFNSGKSPTASLFATPHFSPHLLLFLSTIHFASRTHQCALQESCTDQARHSTGERNTTQPVPCSPLTLGNPQQSECGFCRGDWEWVEIFKKGFFLADFVVGSVSLELRSKFGPAKVIF